LLPDLHKLVANISGDTHFKSMWHIPVSKHELKLTHLITGRWSHPWLDKFMVIVSNPYEWLWPALFIVMFLIYLDWESGIRAVLLGGLGASIADGLNTRLIKSNTDRIRPGKQYSDIRSLGVMNKGKRSFPSNHASNTMSFALGIGFVFPWSLWILLPLSILVGYSRVYCGAHFPLDVLAGWLHGMLWVTLLFGLSQFFI